MHFGAWIPGATAGGAALAARDYHCRKGTAADENVVKREVPGVEYVGAIGEGWPAGQ